MNCNSVQKYMLQSKQNNTNSVNLRDVVQIYQAFVKSDLFYFY